MSVASSSVLGAGDIGILPDGSFQAFTQPAPSRAGHWTSAITTH